MPPDITTVAKDERLHGTSPVASDPAAATLSRFSSPTASKAQLQIEKPWMEPAHHNSDCFLQGIACL
jgi:hypothetical protein